MCFFLKREKKLNVIDTVYYKHILSFSRLVCYGNSTRQNLKKLAESANLTIEQYGMQKPVKGKFY